MATAPKFGSAGVSAQERDLSGPVQEQPTGVPAGVIGTSNKGPAFVPVTVGLVSDFYAKFGPTDGRKFGPLAVTEWLRSGESATFVRVLGVGSGQRRSTLGNTAGEVIGAGFVVGENQPDTTSGFLLANPFANTGGPPGRTMFLGALMSESLGSTTLSSAGAQTGPAAVPMIRGVILSPSGVVARLASSLVSSVAPLPSAVATAAGGQGAGLGYVQLSGGGQNFTLLLNGHKGLDARYPNVLTASFDPTAPNYFANVLNTDPFKIQDAGHLLYASWDIHPALATVTGSGVVLAISGSGVAAMGGFEASAFLTSGSAARNSGTATVPNYENFVDRFRHAVSSWIVSQKFGGKPQNLFRFHMLDAGAGTADKVKISIENIALSTDSVEPYGTFDIIVRDWRDNDNTPLVLEQYRGCSLNPSSDRYVAKMVGDFNAYFDFDRVETAQKVSIDGNYPNLSNYIRVEVDVEVDLKEVDSSAMPCGFRGPAHLVTSGSAPLTDTSSAELQMTGVIKRAMQLPVPYRLTIADGAGQQAAVNSSLYWGTQFEQVTSPNTPNSTLARNDSLKSFAKYFPDFMTSAQNMIEGGKIGVADSTELGVLDADRFNNNLFSLENIQVMTASNGVADPQRWQFAKYVRTGNIPTDVNTKTRALSPFDFTQTNRRFLKFSLFLQGGFDGTNIMDRNEAELADAAVVADMNDQSRGLTNGPTVKAYLKALEVMRNKTDVDIQILAIPGIRHPVVTNSAIDATETRFDAMYVMDIQELDILNAPITSSTQIPSVTNTVVDFKNRGLNTSFAAAYYPDTVVIDPTTRSNVVVPPSVVVLGAIAKSDALGHPWLAPAGFARGALDTTLEAKVKLSKLNMDSLYDANINPLVAFAGSTPAGTQAQGGVKVWGQRTLQSYASALDRVNVRRLLIAIRRDVRDITNTIVFEPNRESTLAKFSAAVEPRLAKVKKQRGVERYLVKIDTSTTTQADIQNNTLRGRIYLQPTKTIEFVSLDFVVTNPGSDL